VCKNPAVEVGIEGFGDFISKDAEALLELFFPGISEFFSAARDDAVQRRLLGLWLGVSLQRYGVCFPTTHQGVFE